jgi:hypothetical protein
MNSKRLWLGAILVLVLGALVGGGTISASDGEARVQGPPFGDLLGRNEIVGTWQATVNRGPLPPLTSLHTFTGDRTMIEFGSDSLFRSPGFGTWEYIGNNTYATTMVMHRFSPTGDHIGSITVNANRRVAPDGESYVGVATNVVRDLNGNVIGGGRATVVARRMHVDPIPDLP